MLDPFQLYVYGPVPPDALAVSVTDDEPAAHHAVGALAEIFKEREDPVTLTMTRSLAVQPLKSVTVTVYGVVAPIPCTTGFAAEVEESPAAGDQLYVYGPVPPVAVKLPPIVVPIRLHEGMV
jgi:hypothetical protein